MSELEFQRELSPEQIREALSLLDSAAEAQNQHLPIGDSHPAEDINPEPDPCNATMATQDRLPLAEDPQQHKKHLKLAVALFGIAMAAAGAAALLSSPDSVHSPPPMLVIAHEQPPELSSAPAAKSDSTPLPVAGPSPDQSPGGSERQPSAPELPGLSGAVGNRADSGSAIALVARADANQAAGTSQVRWSERVSQRPEHTWWHARMVRAAAAKKRFWRLYWQASAYDEWCFVACRRPSGAWCFFACRGWRTQPVFYEPPRRVPQWR
jgi:hypothetical protein